MKDKIEKIIQADESAQEAVAGAEVAAQKIRNQAQQEVKKIIARKEKELAKLKKGEIDKILSEADAKTEHILLDAEHYIEKLKSKKAAQGEALINNLLKRITDF